MNDIEAIPNDAEARKGAADAWFADLRDRMIEQLRKKGHKI